MKVIIDTRDYYMVDLEDLAPFLKMKADDLPRYIIIETIEGE